MADILIYLNDSPSSSLYNINQLLILYLIEYRNWLPSMDSILADGLKALIIQHYRDFQAAEICEKVKVEVIPILITQFFQINSQFRALTSKNASHSMQTTRHKVSCELKERQRLQNKENSQNIDQNLRDTNKKSKGISSIKKNQSLPQEIQNLSSSLNFESQEKSLSFSDIFLTHKQDICKLVGGWLIYKLLDDQEKKLSWHIFFNKVRVQKKKDCLFEKIQKVIEKKHKMMAIKSFQDLISEYQKHDVFEEKLFALVNKSKRIGFQAIRSTVNYRTIKQLEFGPLIRDNSAKFMCLALSRPIKHLYRSFINQIAHSYSHFNKWQVRWVRNIALKTHPNLQTSLWRLKNYHQMKTKAEKFGQIIKKIMMRNVLKHLEKKWNEQINWQMSVSMFSVEEKTQIFVNQVELVYKVLMFNSLLEGFEAIEHAEQCNKQ